MRSGDQSRGEHGLGGLNVGATAAVARGTAWLTERSTRHSQAAHVGRDKLHVGVRPSIRVSLQ